MKVSTIYETCKEIRRLYNFYDSFKIYNEKNAQVIAIQIYELSKLIINEKNSSIPGFSQFDIASILFHFLILDDFNVKDASVSCLTNISSYDQSYALFNSEIFCQNLLIAIRKEQTESSLQKILYLLDNILIFNIQQINCFFIQNNILKILISKTQNSLDSQIVSTSLQIISILCKTKLKNEDVILIYRIICDVVSNHQYENFNLFFMKIFYYLIQSDSFLYNEFINCRFYDLVNASFQKKNLENDFINSKFYDLVNETRFGIKIVYNLIQKYECHAFFNDIQLLNLLIINPKFKEEELCLLSVANTLHLYLDKDPNLFKILLTENSFKNLLNIIQDRDICFKIALLKIFTRLIQEMNSDNFKLVFLIVNNLNIFNILSDLIETEDIDATKSSLNLICIIFTKSVSYNCLNISKNYFQNAFTPSIFDKLLNFQDEFINSKITQLQTYLTTNEQKL